MQSRKIKYISLDFDGCLFHTNYLKEKMQSKKADQALRNTNRSIIDFINKDLQNHPVDEVVCTIGSNRQSKDIDQVNGEQLRIMNDKKQPLANSNFGSCFGMLPTIAKEWIKHKNCHHDGYMLADSYGNVKPGSNFERVTNNKKGQQFDSWFFDHTKVSILYAQMHKAAVDHPGAEEIVFDFYDDRDDILKVLTIFFRQNPDLMPRNISLRLFNYAGGAVSSFCSDIKGEGEVDKNYAKSVVYMSELAGITQDNTGGIGMALLQDPQKLREFKANRGKDILPGSIEHTAAELDKLVENLEENNESDNENAALTASPSVESCPESRYHSIETMRLVHRKLQTKIERILSSESACLKYLNYFTEPGASSFTDRLYELKKNLFILGDVGFNLPVVDEKIRELDNQFRTCYLAISIPPENYQLILKMNTESIENAKVIMAMTKDDGEKERMQHHIMQAELMNRHIHEAMKLLIDFSNQDDFKTQSLVSIFSNQIHDTFSIISKKIPAQSKDPITAYAHRVNWQGIDAALVPSNSNIQDCAAYIWNKGDRKDRAFLSSHGYGNRLITFLEWTASRLNKASAATMQAVTGGVAAASHQAAKAASSATKSEPSCPALDRRPDSISGCLDVLGEVTSEYAEFLDEYKETLIIHEQYAKILEDHVGYKFIGAKIKEELEAFKQKYPNVSDENLASEKFRQELCVFTTKNALILPLISDEMTALSRGDTPKQFYQRVHPDNYEGLFAILNGLKHFCQSGRSYATGKKLFRLDKYLTHFEQQIALAEINAVGAMLCRLRLVGNVDLLQIKPFSEISDAELSSYYPRFMMRAERNTMANGQSKQKMAALVSLTKLKMAGEIFSVQDIKQMNQYILRYGSDEQKAELYTLYENKNEASIPLPEPGRSHLVPDLSHPEDTFENLDDTARKYLDKYLNQRLGISSLTTLSPELQALYDSFIRKIDWNNPGIDIDERIAFGLFDTAYRQVINQLALDTVNEVMPDNELYMDNFMHAIQRSTQRKLPALEDIPGHILNAYKEATKKEVNTILMVDVQEINAGDIVLATNISDIIIDAQQRPTNCYAIVNAVNRHLATFFEIVYRECIIHDKEFAEIRYNHFYVEFNAKRDALFLEFIEAFNRHNDHKIECKLTADGKIPIDVMSWVSREICGEYKERYLVMQQELKENIHGYVKLASHFPHELKKRLISAMQSYIRNDDSESPTTRMSNTLANLSKEAVLEAVLLRMEYAYSDAHKRDQFASEDGDFTTKRDKFAGICNRDWRESGLMYLKDAINVHLDNFIEVRRVAFDDVKSICAQFNKVLDERGIKSNDTPEKTIFISKFRDSIQYCHSRAQLMNICREARDNILIPVNLKSAVRTMLSSFDWEERLKNQTINTLKIYFGKVYSDKDQLVIIQNFLNRCESMCFSVFISEITHLMEVDRKYNLHPLWQQLNRNKPDENAGKILACIYGVLLPSITDIELIAKKSKHGMFDKPASRLDKAFNALRYNDVLEKCGFRSTKHNK